MSLAVGNHLFRDLEQVTARAVSIRHDLHMHPELAYRERYASGMVCRELERLGISYQNGLAGGTGVLAIIEGAAHPHTDRCVALRADMDALPIEEETGLPYASKNKGFMHACGHDGHTAVLLGTAAILQANRDAFAGTIKLVFQPAEEGGLGADRMCADGILGGKHPVQAIFGLHGWPGLKVGMVATRPGPLLASVDGFTIEISGKGGHAAGPQDTVDPIVCAAAIVQALQTIISRETDPHDAAVVTVSQIHAGSAFNIIPEKAELEGTIRALSPKRRTAIIESLERICQGIAAAHRCTAAFRYFGTTPATANTPNEAAFVAETARRVLGPRAYVEAPKPAMWGEDFAFYLQHVPGCFFVLGVQPMDHEGYPSLHNPRYDFTDAALPVGIRMMTELAIGWLNRQP